jgi:hypothetical protein
MPDKMEGSWVNRWIGSLLVLLIPLSIYWPLGVPLAVAILPMYVTPGLYLTDIFAFAVILLGLVRIALKKLPYSIDFSKKTLQVSNPLLLLVCLAFFTSPLAISPALARYTALRWLLALCLFLTLLLLEMPTEQMVKVFMIGLAVQALVGAGQVIHQGPLNLPGELALSMNQFRAAVLNVAGSSWLRAYGLTFHPNVLGGFMCAGLLLGLPLLEKKIMRLVWWLVGLGLVLSFSRSAWMAAVITLPLTIAWVYWKSPKLRRPLVWTLVPACIAVITLLILLRDQLLTRLNPLQTFSEFTSLSERGQLIIIAIASIREHWLTGIGAGNFPLAMTAYETLDPPHYVHHVPLLLAAEVGVLGGIVWYWLWLVPVLSIERFWRSNRIWPVVFIAAWFAWCIISLWDSYPWALESGRLFSVTLLVWISKECIS